MSDRRPLAHQAVFDHLVERPDHIDMPAEDFRWLCFPKRWPSLTTIWRGKKAYIAWINGDLENPALRGLALPDKERQP